MSIFEKIAFIESFFRLFRINESVKLKSEKEIDGLLINISSQINQIKDFDANSQISQMPLFFN